MEWRPHLAVGIDPIDAQHRAIFQQLQQLQRLLAEDGDDEAISAAVVEMRQYMLAHFDEEERHMVANHYPYIEAHCDKHAAMRQDLERMARFMETEKDARGLAFHMVAYLANYLNEHILRMDQPMGDYFQASRSEANQVGQEE